MIAYKDCTYSLFISYAHADDSGEYGWVSSLRKAISQRLDKLDANIPKLGLHLSQDNGPTGGQLGSELRERVAQSFGMLLVIGEKYVSSKWCEKELKFFCEQFGEAGLKSRLYIAVMSEAAVTDAKKGDQWNLVMPEDQLWVPMFEKIERNKPLPHKMDAGEEGFPGLFAAGASKIADRLIIEIEKDYAESKQILLKPGTPGTPRVNVVSPVQRKKIVIGPHTSSLISTVDAIKSALENAGGEVTVLD